MKVKLESNQNYCYWFNYYTGKSITIEKGKVYYHKPGPHLLDVSITNRCNRCCDFCYRKSNKSGTDISLKDYQLILDNAQKCRVQQIAIGGGEPTLHPEFCNFLKMTRDCGIIPNYSTNGENLTREILLQSKVYCGAVAISIYDDIYEYETIIKHFLDFGIKLNLHFILRADKIEEYILLLNKPPMWISKINAIIFLNYKPANGNHSLCFKNCPLGLLSRFFESISLFEACGIGFDTCSVSFICKYLDIDNSLYDFCEAGRKSAFINEKLEVFPCSFYQNSMDSLKSATLKDIWNNSNTFNQHRHLINETCGYDCEKVNVCHSGRPLYSINLCSKCK